MLSKLRYSHFLPVEIIDHLVGNAGLRSSETDKAAGAAFLHLVGVVAGITPDSDFVELRKIFYENFGVKLQ